jgi:uncharacterized protein (DUF362 family)
MKPDSPFLNRRGFLKLLGLSGLSLLLTRCGLLRPPAPAATATPKTLATPTSIPTATATDTPTPTSTPAYLSHVATAKVGNYDPALMRAAMTRMLDDLGGLGDLIKPGARVGIKPNLTGGTWSDPSLPAPATELFNTHPALVQVLIELLIEAGAGTITIMEGLGDPLAYEGWGYSDVARATGAELLDLCFADPYPDFTAFPVGPNYHVYESFLMNPALAELDVFISVAKMKCHTSAGVTLSLKNLFGIPPISLYRRSPDQNNRSSFHGDAAYETRVPRVIVDINQARPVHLAIIDGIMTAEGGAGPWNREAAQVRPGVLVAGKDPVATDAVATAIMGFDPTAASRTTPFLFCDNHLALAAEGGLGTNLLSEIGVHGPSIADLSYPFRPAQAL